MSADEIRKLVRGLNSGKDKPLSTEWELLVLWGLSRSYAVEHEFGHPNEAKLDVAVKHSKDNTLLFSADICCVSDLGYHEDNAVDKLLELLAAATRESGIKGKLSWNVKGGVVGSGYGAQKMRLSLPRRADGALWGQIERRIRIFLASCKSSAHSSTLNLNDLSPGLSITFDTKGSGLAGGHPSYTSTYSITANPVANALGKKALQLKKVGTSGLVGIIACDGGCELLHERHTGSSFTLRDVVLGFLKQTPAVSFVLTLGIESRYPSPYTGRRESHVVKPQLFSTRPSDVGAVCNAVMEMMKDFPEAEVSPDNARRWYVMGTGQEGCRKQPMKSNGNRISVSSRWLMNILAGRVSAEEAFREYTIDMNSSKGITGNPFRRMLENGRLPAHIELNRDESIDDDGISFEFSDVDAAVAPFVQPNERRTR